MTPILRLDERHLKAVIALHHQVIANMPVGTVATETDAFFQSHLDTCGQIFGAFAGDELITYSVLGLPRADDPNFGADHGLSDAELRQVAHIDGVAVRKDHRGSKWQQRMVLHRLEAALDAGRTIALSTAAPGNIASVVNLLGAGMQICGVKDKFGGVRYLVRRDMRGRNALQPPENISHWCPVTDHGTSRLLIDDGFVGVTCRQVGGNATPEIGWSR
jgi:hypothetical protein